MTKKLPTSPNTKQSTYAFKVGDAGWKRLDVLNSICNTGSLHFLKTQKALNSGIKVLEVGCGAGQMTAILAKEILPNGEVDAVDISAEQLQLANKYLKCKKVDNVNLLQLSAYELGKKLKNKYDLIYCRLLLMHLTNPNLAIQNFKRLLKPNGVIISEDSQANTYFCFPQSDTFDYWLNIRLPLFHFDINFGCKAYLIYQQMGFSNIVMQINQPILQSPSQKAFLRYALLEHEKELIGNKKTFSNEKTAIKFINKLIAIEKDKTHVIGFMRMFQICARR